MFPHCNVSVGFFLLVLWFAWINGLGLLGIVLSAAAIHEAGHCLALWGLGARITGLRIGVLGVVLETDSSRLSYGRELAVVLAGPAANLAAAVILSQAGFLTAVGAHLVLGVFNLLPIWPLDGGRAVHLSVSWAFGPVAGWMAVRWVGAAAALLLAGVLLYLMWCTGGSLWLLPTACGALAAGWRNALGKMCD